MTNEYRLITRKLSGGGYMDELTYNGIIVNARDKSQTPPSDDAIILLDDILQANIKFLNRHPNISELEVVISGDELK